MESVSKQETFDIVARHLLTQNKKAATDEYGSQCLYRAGNLKCAAGVLIPDEEYTDAMEGSSIYPECSSLAQACIARHGHDLALVSSLQRIHDVYEPYEWWRRLRDTAQAYGLSTAAVDEVTP